MTAPARHCPGFLRLNEAPSWPTLSAVAFALEHCHEPLVGHPADESEYDQARHQIALDALEAGAIEADLVADRVTLDPRARAIVGLDEAGVTVVEMVEYLVHPDDRERVTDLALGALAGERGGRWRVTWRFAHPDDHIVWLRLDGQVIFAGPWGLPARVVAVLVDVTDAHEAERELRRAQDRLETRVHERTAELLWANAQLRSEAQERRRAEAAQHQLLRQLATVEENERRRIARDLHDQTGQLLVGLSLALRRVALDAELSPRLRGQLDGAQRIVDELGRQVHGLAVRLRPTVLDDLGLSIALQQLVTDWSMQVGVVADLQVTGLDVGRLPAEVETVLYRVVQEALTNVARHAQARQVSVVVHRHEGHATAVVEDDGRGFDPALVGHDRLGLAGMRERVALAGGQLDVEATGLGTTIIARLPTETPRRHPGDAH
ncbi:MAG: PAS domain S-box protein [Myxococcales bacterium]|nr:MAG: PAS domain S-box protein [Myxococcales bacterium]